MSPLGRRSRPSFLGGMRTCSSSGSLDPILVRDFISNSLYNPEHGYFMKDVIYSPTRAESPEEETVFVDFNELAGEAEYKLMLQEMYQKRGVAWLTPCEIFAPWYSFALGNYICQQRDTNRKDLRIIEFGGGNGTNMLYMLDFIKAMHPELYKTTTAVLVDISPAMSERQEALVKPKHKCCSFVNADICNPRGSKLDRYDEECFVVGLEVLDNLTHDKVVRCADSGDWLETLVQADDGGKLREVHQPLRDDDIRIALEHFSFEREATPRVPNTLMGKLLSGYGRPKSPPTSAAFVPSGAMQMIAAVHEWFPKHKLLLADFDSLPSPTVPLFFGRSESLRDGTLEALNPPLVAGTTSKGKDRDYETYLLPPGTADIFFATDFDSLSEAYRSITGRQALMHRSSEFLTDFGDIGKTEVSGGYNPMLHDFINTRFLVTA